MLENILELYDWLFNAQKDISDPETKQKCIHIMTNIQNYLDIHGPEQAMYAIIAILNREMPMMYEEDEEDAPEDDI